MHYGSDEGITTARQRIVGRTTEIQVTPKNQGEHGRLRNNYSVKPDYLKCKDKAFLQLFLFIRILHITPLLLMLILTAVFANLLGQEEETMTQVRGRTLEIGTLPKGVYFIKVYKGEKFVGSAKFNKN